jgi:phosphoribosylformylglycinamidine cyclo-ligase
LNARTAYAEAGVNVEAGERAVELLRAKLHVSGGDLLGGIGAFGAAVEVPAGYRRPVIVTATDGVGTKTEIARRLGRLGTIGQDLVAMCADDVVCHGARSTYFLDYLAVGRVDPESVAEIVGGVAEACEAIGCTLIGGETAEHPGLMAVDVFDLAGFCIGFVEHDGLIDGTAARAGDVVIGLASSGLHANGYSLVRGLLDKGAMNLEDAFAGGPTLGDALLAPTRLYSPAVLALAAHLGRRGLRLGGLAHITGGGLPGNLPRGVGPELGVRLQLDSWPVPPIFGLIGQVGNVAPADMRATFNCGIGFAAIVEPAAAEATVDLLRSNGIEAWPIGEVRPAAELGGRYAEA